jgi:3-phenylpropionate/trans-cinnamate dioxygenase ferredoxin reductase subunit
VPEVFVIVGANLAGGSAAVTLRRDGFEGRVILIGEEHDPPYERPPLSKDYLRGETEFERSLVQSPEFYEDNQIETLLGVRAERVDAPGHVVELADGDRIPYDKVLITTGGKNRTLRVPGAELDGVYDLRTREHAERIRGVIASASKAVVVGMGFIGAEVAASLRQVGLDVVAVEPLSVPLARALGEDLGRVVASMHADQGVDLILGDTVTEFRGANRVEQVLTERGRVIDCDLVVVGVGIEPATEVTEGTGVILDNGIVVDEFCRTNVDRIYAAGDVANHFHPLVARHIRVEHWQNAIRQASAAARSMMDKGEPYRDVHWFWSDQYDVNIQYAGFHGEWDEMVVRGRLAERDFIAFRLDGGRIQSAVAFNRRRELRRAMKLIEEQVAIDPAALRDEGVDLKTLARS